MVGSAPEISAARAFRILSIDGGGIKGAYSASVLATLEETTGKRCIDHFDLIAGTSTGGIIAIGLALGLSAADIRDFYIDRGSEIFPAAGIVGGKVRMAQQLLQPKHDANNLRTTLGAVFADRSLGEAKTRLVIPAYDVTHGRIFVFKTAHHEHLSHDIDIPAVEVAMATAAAPTFFRSTAITQHGGASYVDGGLWANNPTLVAVTEAIHFCGQQPNDIDILSVGTTTEPFDASAKRNKAGVIGWSKALVDILMAGPAEAALNQAQLITGRTAVRIDHLTTRGRFGLDKTEGIADLVALGRGDANERHTVTEVSSRFLNGRAMSPFVPVHATNRRV